MIVSTIWVVSPRIFIGNMVFFGQIPPKYTLMRIGIIVGRWIMN